VTFGHTHSTSSLSVSPTPVCAVSKGQSPNPITIAEWAQPRPMHRCSRTGTRGASRRRGEPEARSQNRPDCDFVAMRADDAGSLHPSEEAQRRQGGVGDPTLL